MTINPLLVVQQLSSAESPEATRDVILKMGFNGLLFQRWYPETMDNWEGYLKEGFLEHYYGTQLYKACPVAKAIHTWTRDYTFAEARVERDAAHPDASRVAKLYEQFGMNDGVVLLTGTHVLRSAVILTTSGSAHRIFTSSAGILAFAARQLTEQLPTNHELLSQIGRDDPQMSALQNKILQMQIDHPELSNAEMAATLKLSPKTLHAHHKKIAKKNGVTTFAGAVIKRMKETG